ncbi:hypothetical protein SS209_04044 [Salmonella enterica subsp. enterica serovar Senftenberg str. SS209]|nr:hypothetical protein SEES004_10317 [Salmonella enterica subsp. enterica serovar Senftenberg str. 361154004]ESC22606.1 hypothetical protein SEEM841_02767 [Salmonella enterica subsp. enterica serovar Senftenberg str. 423984-1]ESC81862.1 hypothetical protein SEEM038_13318 [Salmonella enterica subsp. enterica serovar Senftenberg str. NC_MB012510-0038]ESG36783.1 hypothetical protein SEEM842_09213 [Salmonella enterica subsp. enterica serovar Senftenberg str. 423984-2]ESG55393.1 hypothetical protei
MLIRVGLINYYEQFFLTLSLEIMTIMKRGVSSLEPKGMQQKRLERVHDMITEEVAA